MPVDEWVNTARSLAREFRLGMSVSAALSMVDLVYEVNQAIESTGLRIEFDNIVRHMLSCQESQDWLGLADYLEYEFVKMLFTID